MMKTKLILIVLFLICAIMLTSCTKEEKQSKFVMAKPAHVSNVIQGTVPMYIDTIGLLKPELSVDIRSQATGKIDNYYFKEGQFVQKGDLLFTIDPRSYQALLDQSKATLRQNTAIRNLAKYVVDKNRKLPLLGAMAVQDYARDLADYEKADAEVAVDLALIQQNQIMLDYCKIASPIDGVTGYRQVDPGNIVIENSGPILVNIKKIDPIKVDFTIPEKNFSLLREAMNEGSLEVIITTKSFNVDYGTVSKEYHGKLELLDNIISPKTGTISLQGIVPNKERELWPGEFVEVKLIYFYQKNALLVPYLAVNSGAKGDYVYCVKNGKAVLFWVKTGLRYGDYIKIDSIVGSEKFVPGDQIVTIGQMGINPGDPINIVGKDSFQIPNSAQPPAKPEI